MNILKKFLSYYRPYQALFWCDMFCALAVCAIDLAFPQILKLLTTGLFTEGTEAILRSLWLIGVGLLLLYIVR